MPIKSAVNDFTELFQVCETQQNNSRNSANRFVCCRNWATNLEYITEFGKSSGNGKFIHLAVLGNFCFFCRDSYNRADEKLITNRDIGKTTRLFTAALKCHFCRDFGKSYFAEIRRPKVKSVQNSRRNQINYLKIHKNIQVHLKSVKILRKVR